MRDYRVLVLNAPHRMMRLNNRPGFRFFTVAERDDENSRAKGYQSYYARAVAYIKPDFIVFVNAGCSEQLCEQWLHNTSLKAGVQVITWSTDSYRHTRPVRNSTIHFSGIYDEATAEYDNHLPLYGHPLGFLPLAERAFNFGILWRDYSFSGAHRDYRRKLIRSCTHLDFDGSTSQKTYNKVLSNFRFGLNVSVYPDSMANFRSFELLGSGVMPVCPIDTRTQLTPLFGEHTLFFSDPAEIPELLKANENYDPEKLLNHLAHNHTINHRFKTIFEDYFGLKYPIIPADSAWCDPMQQRAPTHFFTPPKKAAYTRFARGQA